MKLPARRRRFRARGWLAPALIHAHYADVPITVSLVEDDHRMRESFAAMLNRAPTLRCVSTYATAEEGVAEMPKVKPDVALVDIHLPGMDGIECVAKLKKVLPDLQILMLTRYEQSDLIFNSIRAGASGYLLKSSPPAELILSVELVHAGGAPMSMQIARKVARHFRKIVKPTSDVEKLTAREQELVELLAKGYSYKELSDKLGITINTVRTHLQHIYEKLHVQSRTQAVLKVFGPQ